MSTRARLLAVASPARKSTQPLCLQSFAASLLPLLRVFPLPALCFQWLAASLANTPGWGLVEQPFLAVLRGNTRVASPSPSSRPSISSRLNPLCVSVPARPAGGPLWRIPLLRLTSFRMNICKSMSKQRTLTIFGINTCAKPGGRGSSTCRSLRDPEPSHTPSLLDHASPTPYNGKFTVTHFFDSMNSSHSPAGARWAALFYAPNPLARMQ
jgi:hypothetical protein